MTYLPMSSAQSPAGGHRQPRRARRRRFDVDWADAGYADDDLDELAEHLLRVIQSFVTDPGRPTRTDAELRRYLRRWVAPALQGAVVGGSAH